MTQQPAPPSPCIGLCSTGLGDSVCRGCKRFEMEVKNWNTLYAPEQKEAVECRLVNLMSRVMHDKVQVIDEPLLRSCLEKSGAPYPKHRDALCLVWDLLRMTGSHINAPCDFGFLVYPQYADLSPVELRTLIDDAFYQLSIAYYERYVDLAHYANLEIVQASWHKKGKAPKP